MQSDRPVGRIGRGDPIRQSAQRDFPQARACRRKGRSQPVVGTRRPADSYDVALERDRRRVEDRLGRGFAARGQSPFLQLERPQSGAGHPELRAGFDHEPLGSRRRAGHLRRDFQRRIALAGNLERGDGSALADDDQMIADHRRLGRDASGDRHHAGNFARQPLGVEADDAQRRLVQGLIVDNDHIAPGQARRVRQPAALASQVQRGSAGQIGGGQREQFSLGCQLKQVPAVARCQRRADGGRRQPDGMRPLTGGQIDPLDRTRLSAHIRRRSADSRRPGERFFDRLPPLQLAAIGGDAHEIVIPGVDQQHAGSLGGFARERANLCGGRPPAHVPPPEHFAAGAIQSVAGAVPIDAHRRTRPGRRRARDFGNQQRPGANRTGPLFAYGRARLVAARLVAARRDQRQLGRDERRELFPQLLIGCQIRKTLDQFVAGGHSRRRVRPSGRLLDLVQRLG